MTDDFDPYYTWLGIPPEEQPANYYRLLGVRQFEPSLDVISNAGDQRMAFLRTFQVGKRSVLSQRLLNEIAGAKVCLLDPEQRRVYDQKLKSSTAASKGAQPAPDPRQAGDWQVHDTPLVYVTDDVPLDAGGNGSNPVTSWFKDTLNRYQNVPRRTVAYGGLVLGAMLLMSPLLWIALGGNRRPPAVAKDSTPPEPNPTREANPIQTATEPSTVDSAKKPAMEIPAAPSIRVSAAPLPAYTPRSVPAAEDASPMSAGNTDGSEPIVDYSPLVQVVPGRFRLPYQVGMSPSGEHLIFWRSGESQVYLFRVGQRIPDQLLTPVISCAAAGKGIVACGTDKALMVFSISDPRLLWTTSIPGPAREIAVSADGEKVAVLCDADKPLAVFSIQDRRALGPFDIGNSRLASVGVTNNRAAFIIDHAAMGVIDVRTGALESILQHPQASVFRQICFNGPLLCASDDQSIFWMGEPGKGMKTWTSKRRPPGARVIWHSPSSGLIAMVHKSTITLVKSPEDEIHASIVWPEGDFGTVAFSLGGNNRMVTRGPDDSLLVWDLNVLRHRSTQTMYSGKELAAWKPFSSPRSSPMPVAILPRTEPRPRPIAPPKPVPDYGPLEEVEPAEALAALRRAGVRNLPDDPASVRNITLQGSQFANSDAKYIAAFRDLENLFCDDRPINGQTLRYFQGLTELTQLSLGGTAITDEDLTLISGLKGLRTLRLQGTKITAKGLVHIEGLTSLRDLQLPHDIGREAIPSIANLQELRFLNPFPADMTDQDLANLSQVRHLQRLDLSRARLSTAGYQILTSFQRVDSLQLHHETPREALPCLREMRLSNFQFPPSARDEDVSLLEHMPTLRNVTLNETMTDAGLARVVRYPAIQELWLSRCNKVSNEGLRHLGEIKNLRELHLSAGIGDAGLKHLSGITTLENINLAYDCPVTDDGLAALVDLPNLQKLAVSSQVTDRGCETLAKIKTLQLLFFQHESRIGAEGLKQLKALDKLQHLAIPNVPLNHKGVKELATLTQLRFLSIQANGITPEWEAELRAALPNTHISISK